jgi:hypothetical protein
VIWVWTILAALVLLDVLALYGCMVAAGRADRAHERLVALQRRVEAHERSSELRQ